MFLAANQERPDRRSEPFRQANRDRVEYLSELGRRLAPSRHCIEQSSAVQVKREPMFVAKKRVICRLPLAGEEVIVICALKLPLSVGVPEIRPVELFKVTPDGNVPPIFVNVKGPVPPMGRIVAV